MWSLSKPASRLHPWTATEERIVQAPSSASNNGPSQSTESVKVLDALLAQNHAKQRNAEFEQAEQKHNAPATHLLSERPQMPAQWRGCCFPIDHAKNHKLCQHFGTLTCFLPDDEIRPGT